MKDLAWSMYIILGAALCLALWYAPQHWPFVKPAEKGVLYFKNSSAVAPATDGKMHQVHLGLREDGVVVFKFGEEAK